MIWKRFAKFEAFQLRKNLEGIISDLYADKL